MCKFSPLSLGVLNYQNMAISEPMLHLPCWPCKFSYLCFGGNEMAKFDHSRTNSNIAFVTNFVSEESSNLPARTLVGVRRREKKMFFFSDRGVKILARMDKGVGYHRFQKLNVLLFFWPSKRTARNWGKISEGVKLRRGPSARKISARMSSLGIYFQRGGLQRGC